MSLFHELSHLVYGTVDPKVSIVNGKEVYYPNKLGSAVGLVNKIRTELGLPLKVQYEASLSEDGRLWNRFDEGDICVYHINKLPGMVHLGIMLGRPEYIVPRIKQEREIVDEKPKSSKGCLFGNLWPF